MALTDTHRHAIGWLERNIDTGVVNYKVSFSTDNSAASWNSPIVLGSYTSTPGSAFSPSDIDLASNENGHIGILTYYKVDVNNPDSLVLYLYDTNLVQTKVNIVSGNGAKCLTPSCNSFCFSLTGDSNNAWNVFYYSGSSPNIQGRVTTVDSAGNIVTPVPRVLPGYFSSNSVPAVGAARTLSGTAFIRWTGVNTGIYDVPLNVSLPIPTLPRTSTFNLLGDPDDGPYSDTVRATNGINQEGNNPSIRVWKVSASGVSSYVSQVNDPQTLPYCDTIPCTSSTVGQHCYHYATEFVNGLGGVVIGNTYFSTSLLTELTCSGTQYLATKERVVIHQTSAEP
jgi:hypothetical protein